MDVGLELRQARERRGLSLERLSSTTKISPRVLQAIETCDDRQLPAWVFTRSFVKSYATEVGLDPQDTVRRYLEQFEPPAPEETQTAEASRPKAPTPEAVETESPRSGARVLRGRFGTATTVALLAIGVLALAAGRLSRHRGADVPPPVAMATAGLVPAAPAPLPVGTSGTSTSSGDLHIAISPTGPCWVQASVGADRVFGALLTAGETRTLDAPADVTLRVGDPSTFLFAINGRAARLDGQPGQAVTVHITRQNYTRYLSH
jgi:hypothetical protein